MERPRTDSFSAGTALAILGAALLAPQASAQVSLTWKCTTDAARWADKTNIVLSNTVAPPATKGTFRIFVNSTNAAQVIDGWGGCFNERGWRAMESLTTNARDEVMRALFDTNGLNLNIMRTPIGASDYAVDPYSLNETAGDYGMTNFSIARDQQRLLPYIKAAQAIRPDLYLWAVPWSPPSWMKKNNSLIGTANTNATTRSEIKDDAQTLDALALYFARYVQAYKAEGVNVQMVMPQNEPDVINNYPTCLWTGEQLAKFVGYHLGPALANAGLPTKIFLGCLNDSGVGGGYPYWVAPSMGDLQTRMYVAGAGFQWSADVAMNETRVMQPALKLIQTETECGGSNTNNWNFAETQYALAKKWFNAGASANVIWNLVLDQTGLSTGGWAQNSPVVVNTNTKTVTYTPFYYMYKHFSHFVQPGARFVSVYSTWGDKLAFKNPDGSVVAVIGNSADFDYKATLNFDGWQSDEITLPANSFSTFVMPASVTALEQWRMQNFGITANSGDAADAADPDGDLATNTQEFIAGTDPKNPNSYLKISQVAPSGQGATITFTTVPGKTYRVDYTDSLQPPDWQVLLGGITAATNVTQVLDPSASSLSQRFYRAVVGP